MAAQLERDAHFLKVPNGDCFVLSGSGHPAAGWIEGDGIHGRGLDGKLAIRMAERSASIIVRTSRDGKWPGWTRTRYAASEAQEEERGPAGKRDEFLAAIFHERSVDRACVALLLQLSGETGKGDTCIAPSQ